MWAWEWWGVFHRFSTEFKGKVFRLSDSAGHEYFVSWDKIWHLIIGAGVQDDWEFGGEADRSGLTANILIEMIQTLPPVPQKYIDKYQKVEWLKARVAKPFVVQDVVAGQRGGQLVEDMVNGTVTRTNFDLQSYFEYVPERPDWWLED